MEPFVIIDRGGSASLEEGLAPIVANASIVELCGGVFSPSMLWGGRLAVGLRIGVKLGPGIGVEFAESLSDLGSGGNSRGVVGVVGLISCLLQPPSIIKLKSRTEPCCNDCSRRCEPPLTRPLSGDPSPRLTTALLSRARSFRAAWADWMALDVPAREVKPGDWGFGFNGRGGGARSGSELSHLLGN